MTKRHVELRRATLKDVAARAKVDPSLVSRLVNGDARLSISDATRERVLHAIDELGYQPNVTAKALRLGRTYLIGLLVPDLANPVYADLILGAQEAAHAGGYSILIGSASAGSESDAWLDRLLHQARVDGMLLVSSTLEDRRLAEIVGREARILIVNRLMPGATRSVVVDDEAGSRLAAQHLLDLGHREVGIVVGPPNVETTERRRRGFLETLAAHGDTLAPETLVPAVTPGAGYDATMRLLREHPTLTAIYASTLMLGMGVLKAVQESARAVPDDVSVIALNDAELARYTNPALTTIAMPYQELGRVAVERTVRQLQGDDHEGVVMVAHPPPRLIRRASTGPSPHRTSIV